MQLESTKLSIIVLQYQPKAQLLLHRNATTKETAPTEVPQNSAICQIN